MTVMFEEQSVFWEKTPRSTFDLSPRKNEGVRSWAEGDICSPNPLVSKMVHILKFLSQKKSDNAIFIRAQILQSFPLSYGETVTTDFVGINSYFTTGEMTLWMKLTERGIRGWSKLLTIPLSGIKHTIPVSPTTTPLWSGSMGRICWSGLGHSGSSD